MNPNIPEYDDGVLRINRKNLQSIPTKDQYANTWDSIVSLDVSENKITELNASDLPPNLTYLDVSRNPIRKITGDLPESIEYLVLAKTQLQIIPKLPSNLVNLSIEDTPVGKRLNIRSYEISDPLTFKRIEDWGPAVQKYDILKNITPSNSEFVNFVMVHERIEKEDGLYYSVEDIHGKLHTIRKENLNLYEPLYGETIQPIPRSTGAPNTYTVSGHAYDLLFEKPVPPGCVYVTIEECGVPSSDWEKLYLAFEDKPRGIREKLRDPVKYREELTLHFGRAFHVHWPEAPIPEDRTYVEAVHYPVLVWDRYKSFRKEGEPIKWEISKSGITSLNQDIVYTNPRKAYNGSTENSTFFTIDGDRIDETKLHFMYDDSLYPTHEQVTTSLYILDDPENVSTQELNDTMKQFNFLQSWAFKQFPGVHYNFSCRTIHPDLSTTNKRINTRRRKSVIGRVNIFSKITNYNTQLQNGSKMLLESLEVNQPEVALKLLEWPNINVNIASIFGDTPIFLATKNHQYEVVKELVKHFNLEDVDKSIQYAKAAKELENVLYKSDLTRRDTILEQYKKQKAVGSRNSYNSNYNSNYNTNLNNEPPIRESDIPDEPVLEHKWDGIIVLLEQFIQERKYRNSLIYSGGYGNHRNRTVRKKRTTRKLRKGKPARRT